MTDKRTLSAALLALVLASPAAAQEQKRLWVLEPPDKIIEYDLLTFAPVQTVTVPPAVLEAPRALAINHQGQMLFAPTQTDAGFEPGEEATLWFWDGHTATFRLRGITHKLAPAGSHFSELWAVPQPRLSADGAHLFWFANRFDKVVEKSAGEPESSLDLSTRTIFRAWQTDLGGTHSAELAAFSFPPCDCGTAVCEETCPEAEVWSPEGGVTDFFLVTHWISGQIGADYQATFVYRHSGSAWTVSQLPSVIEYVLDAAEGGDIRIEAILDGGCCGWVNASNDRTLLTRNGKTVVLFDERVRYQNPDYDISFYTPVARLAPGLTLVALEIDSDPRAGSDIGLSDEGHADPAQLARLQQAAAGLPTVEVLRADDPDKPVVRLSQARLVGWLNDKEILVLEDGLLVAFNVETGARRKSGIRVPQAAFVFLR